MRSAKVIFGEIEAGMIKETEDGYQFTYFEHYLNHKDAHPISLTLPLRSESYTYKTMIPFFDGLIPEGWLLDIAIDTWKIDLRDRMGLLLACCKDCIGAVSIVPEQGDEND